MYYHVTKRNLCAIFVLFALTLNVAWSGASSRSLIVSSSFLLSLLDSQSEWQQQYEKRCLKTGQSKRTIKTKSEKHRRDGDGWAHAHQHSSSFGTLLLSSWLVLSSLIGDGVMLIRSLALRVSILNLSFGRYTSFFLNSFDGAAHSFSSVSVASFFCFFPNVNWSCCCHCWDALLYFSFTRSHALYVKNSALIDCQVMPRAISYHMCVCDVYNV